MHDVIKRYNSNNKYLIFHFSPQSQTVLQTGSSSSLRRCEAGENPGFLRRDRQPFAGAQVPVGVQLEL